MHRAYGMRQPWLHPWPLRVNEMLYMCLTSTKCAQWFGSDAWKCIIYFCSFASKVTIRDKREHRIHSQISRFMFAFLFRSHSVCALCAIWDLSGNAFILCERATPSLTIASFWLLHIFLFRFVFCVRRNEKWLDERQIRIAWMWRRKNVWMQRSHSIIEINEYAVVSSCCPNVKTKSFFGSGRKSRIANGTSRNEKKEGFRCLTVIDWNGGSRKTCRAYSK